ncbi:hypothetical protein GCM10023188_25690 [Pontibacter saemangeumensis]|uniref:Portal protein n=1 Tax=Pontibacter saemangeumensis TaxID=1084525 RepID=A0ABP8LT02_9BACT
MKRPKVKARTVSRPVAFVQSQKSTGTGKQQERGSAKIIEYGKGNKLPDEIIKVFLASPTARRCWLKLKKFIQADGFSERAAAAVRANPRQTTDDLLPYICWDAAVFGFALRVKYNLSLKVAEVYHVPFHTVRKLDDGRFLVNPNLGTDKEKREDDEILDAFDDSEEAVKRCLTQVGPKGNKQPGQLLYSFEESSVHPHYPEPAAWSAKPDIESDTEIQRADYNAIRKRVKPNVGVFIPGEYDEDNLDEDGKSEMDYLEDEVRTLTDPEGEGDAVLFTGAGKEDAPQLITIDGMKATLSMDAKSETIRKRICMAFGLHPSLIGMDTTGQLGNTQQLLNIIQLTQQEVLDVQGLIQRAFKKLWPDFDWTLTSLNIIKAVPEQIWQIMTEEEKRNFGGYSPLEKEQTPEGEKVLNALNSLSPLVATKVLESMTKEQILALVGLVAEEEPTTQTEAAQANATNTGRFQKIRAAIAKHLPGAAAK